MFQVSFNESTFLFEHMSEFYLKLALQNQSLVSDILNCISFFFLFHQGTQFSVDFNIKKFENDL